MALIETRALRKVSIARARWKERAAIDGITFAVEEGASLACIGENGAGKSTLIKMLVGVLVGTLLRASTYRIGACNVLWLTSDAQTNVTYMIHSIGEYVKYPVNLYPVWMQVILLVLIPFGFIGYVPVVLLRGGDALLWGLAMAVMAVGYALLARGVFCRGIHRHESMGM